MSINSSIWMFISNFVCYNLKLRNYEKHLPTSYYLYSNSNIFL